MRFIRYFIFCCCVAPLPVIAVSQKKYALIVSIDDYYKEKNVKSDISLRGSVNDGRSFRQLLMSKFGYKSSDIDTLFDVAATHDAIVNGLQQRLKLCKAGDKMMFYFSGHGIWMNNSQLAADTIKKGRNQALLTSDLYNYDDHFKCFLRDVTLKEIFNRYVDKRVVLTSVFDCCYSGNMSMASPTDYMGVRSVDAGTVLQEAMGHLPDAEERLKQMAGISIVTPAGCGADSANPANSRDTDYDGVPDCADYELQTNVDCFPVNAKGIGRCSLDLLLAKAIENSTPVDSPVLHSRAFNAHVAITISERDMVKRPVDRKNSGYLSLAATREDQKALEFTDEQKVVHGLFTGSLIRLFKTLPAGTPMSVLFEKLQADMKTFKLNQDPVLRSDPARLKNDLSGQAIIKK